MVKHCDLTTLKIQDEQDFLDIGPDKGQCNRNFDLLYNIKSLRAKYN